MITVKIHGGLGNQMFQYACGRALAFRNKTDLRIDPSPLYDFTPRKNFIFRKYALSTVFSIDPVLAGIARRQKAYRLPYIDTFFNKYSPWALGALGYWQYVKEKKSSFDPRVNQLQGNVYLDGYWQSEKYFEDEADVIRKDFSFRNALTGKAAALVREISSGESICLNVRRGDYVNNPASMKTHNVMAPDFFKRAIAIMKERLGSSGAIFIFSDEIDWCRKNLAIDGSHVFVDHEYAGTEFRDYLQLMSLCKHFIIPNSTFAWWGAWLSGNREKIVIAPKEWFKDPSIDTRDITPANWLRI